MEISPAVLALVPVVIGLTALAKTYIEGRWAPLVALVLGFAGAFLVSSEPAAATAISGIVVGLTASGLYSGAKATFF